MCGDFFLNHLLHLHVRNHIQYRYIQYKYIRIPRRFVGRLISIQFKKAGGIGGGIAEFDEGGLKKDKKVKGWLKSNRNKFLGTVGMSLVSSPNNYLTEFLLLSNQDF